MLSLFGDMVYQGTLVDLNDPVWIERHSYKLIETYGIFILLLSISGLLIIIFNKSVVIKV